MCALLVDVAAQRQGCDSAASDLGPLLRLAVESHDDVQVRREEPRYAEATIPSLARPAAGIPKGADKPQLLRLREAADGWRIFEMGLREADAK